MSIATNDALIGGITEASFTVTIVALPVINEFTVTPNTGKSFIDLFTATVIAVTAYPPLKYQFRYVTVVPPVMINTGDTQYDRTHSMLLPAGNVTVYVDVIDNIGGITTSLPITVLFVMFIVSMLLLLQTKYQYKIILVHYQ
jgi:hypothetical protein